MRKKPQLLSVGQRLPSIVLRDPPPPPLDNTAPRMTPPVVLCARCGEAVEPAMGCQAFSEGGILGIFHAACWTGD